MTDTGIAIGVGVGPFDGAAAAGPLTALDWYVVAKERGKSVSVRDSVTDFLPFNAINVTETGGQSDRLGGSTAVLLEKTAGVGTNGYVTRNFTPFEDNAIYCFQCEVKDVDAGVTMIKIDARTSGGRGQTFEVDLSDGSVNVIANDPVNPITAFVEDLGSGWYRLACFGTHDGIDTAIKCEVYACDNTGSGASGTGILVAFPAVDVVPVGTTTAPTPDTVAYNALLDQRSGGRHMFMPGGSANPLVLSHTAGADYFYLPGTSGNYLSVPDSAALDITGDIDIRFKISKDDWTDTNHGICGKFESTGDQRSWYVLVNQYGYVSLLWTEDGTAATIKSATTSAPIGTTDGVAEHIRITMDVDNGASDSIVTFYKGGSGATPTWVQHGSTDALGATTSIYASTAPMEIGQYDGSVAPWPGTVEYVQVLDGIDGTTVLDVQASDADPDSTTFTEASTNAATVTINRSASGYKTEVVDQTLIAFATDDYMSHPDDALFDVGASDDFTAFVVARTHGNQPGTAGFLTKAVTNNGQGWRLYTTGGTAVATYTNVRDGSANSAFDQAPNKVDHALFVLAGVLERAVGDDIESYLDGTGSGTPTDASGVGTLENSTGLGLGCFDGGATESDFADMVFVAAAFTKSALTASEIAEVGTALIAANAS